MVDRTTLVPVEVACPCPGTPHAGDEIFLYPELGFQGGVVTIRKLSGGGDADELTAVLLDCYLRYGIADWTLVDADGKATPVDKEAIVAFSTTHFDAAIVVANKADDLYSGRLLGPLAIRAANSSATSRTNGLTSVSPQPSTSRKRSRPSSTSTTATEQPPR